MSSLNTLSQLLESKVAAVAPLVRSMRAAVAASSAQRFVPAPWCASTLALNTKVLFEHYDMGVASRSLSTTGMGLSKGALRRLQLWRLSRATLSFRSQACTHVLSIRCQESCEQQAGKLVLRKHHCVACRSSCLNK